jgi:hypothetical protein
MNSPDYVAIMAILNAMARCVNENIGKIDLTPLSGVLAAGSSTQTGITLSETNQT